MDCTLEEGIGRMSKHFCLAVNGLDEWMFGGPLSALAGFLNENTPAGVHFNVVGDTDPRPYIDEFIHTCAAAAGNGSDLILLGHSLGAMMMFYLADAMKAKGIAIPLVVSIDSTDWGTNSPKYPPYTLGIPAPDTGQYWVPDNVDHWLHFRQPVYPGGGVAQLAAGNTHTKFENFERLESHVSLPVIPDIQQKILAAVLAATSA
jgi:hypothetical protein